jgi:hypothetical protein
MDDADTKSLWEDLLEKDDRTSPPEYPNMALITSEEFENAMRSARKAALIEALAKIDAQIAAAEKDGARGGDLRDVWLCRGEVVTLLNPPSQDQEPRPAS